MPKQYVVLYPRNYVGTDGKKRTSFRNIGTAFPARNGEGFDMNITEMPPHESRTKATSDGEMVEESYWRILVREKTDKPEQGGNQNKQRQNSDGPAGYSPDEEETPF